MESKKSKCRKLRKPRKPKDQKRFNKEAFARLERRWYQKLEKSGFQDIEDTANPNRPLKCWHSFKFKLRPAVQRDAKSSFFDMAWSLLHTTRFKAKHYRRIWGLFCEGMSVREIAKKVHLPKSTVHWIIARISKEIQWK